MPVTNGSKNINFFPVNAILNKFMNLRFKRNPTIVKNIGVQQKQDEAKLRTLKLVMHPSSARIQLGFSSVQFIRILF